MTGDGTPPVDERHDAGTGRHPPLGRLPGALSHLAAEQSPVGMVLLDDEHCIRWMNAGFRTLLDGIEGDPLGAPIGEFVTRPLFLNPDRAEAPDALGDGWQQVRLGAPGRLVLVTASPPREAGLRLLTFVDPHVASGTGSSGLARPGDPVTRLASVWLFEDRLRHALERARRPSHRVALLLLRLDHRASLRHRLGAEGVEALVRQVERRLTQTLRQEDSLSQLGDGCWGVLIEHPLSPEGLQATALRCLEAMDPPFRLDGCPQLLSLSVGIAIAPEDGDTAEELLSGAEAALERAGPSRHAFFDDGLKRRLARDMAFRQELQEALLDPDRHFRVLYQPQIDLRCGRCVGLEALVRWEHPRHGLLAPHDFLPVVEELGQQVRLDRWVIAAVVAQHARWRAQGSWLADMGVAVNAGVGLLDQAAFDRRPLDVFLRQQAISPGFLTLELAQQDLAAQAQAQVHLLHRLASLGVDLVVNDFDAASLDLPGLAALSVSRVKLSRGLSDALVAGGSRDRVALEALLQCLAALRLEAVLVGVETAAQLNAAVALGVPLAQGNRLGEPQSAEALECRPQGRQLPL
ncbi:EAL domain-containing protein [Halomonas beimenensis]|uniref:Diguanylate cyclase/phosphodiesterase (GGDEF & EAL domains) with PAS/PAC sensor(S) n=1 Tax=Halomonas beimenensis TaxID=475662 RepID=A0A291PCT6_9GAMM|nr:GGDEF domain-containing phosphodiesterase [Halomonas beimenensis]ATJ84692.1 diguanylate cyclase/phosphodiesterase (GGDEF & EAL domains) with PAS/PAC sensor(s) [Halomonas beimenensis]